MGDPFIEASATQVEGLRAERGFDLRNRLFVGTRHIDWLTSSFWLQRA